MSRAALVEELVGDVRALGNYADVLASLRRFKRRETMRIAYGDIVRNQPVATVARQISYLADAIVEAALDFARRHLEEQYGQPLRRDGEPQPIRRARPRQAGRPRAELFQRHRSGLLVRAGRPDRRPPHREQRGVFRAAGEGSDPAADRDDRLGRRRIASTCGCGRKVRAAHCA